MNNTSKYLKYSKQQLIAMLVKENSNTLLSPGHVYHAIIEQLDAIKFSEVECFAVATLDGAHQLVGFYIVSKGLVNRTLVHPREVFRPAIVDNAVAVIVAHNHPSGNLELSEEDKDVTKRLKLAGDILGIKVLDHLLVSPSLGYYSMLEHSTF